MMNEDADWEWQKLKLENILANVDGDEFETTFQNIAKAAWGVDFTPTIPMGSRGDLKCDGYRHSTKEVFQAYGPRYGQVNVSDAVQKVDADFVGAVGHWGKEIAVWTFVVNVYRGRVPSEVILAIQEQSSAQKIPANLLTRSDILDLAQTIAPKTRAEMWGSAPTSKDMRRVTYEYIGKALAVIKCSENKSEFAPVLLPPPLAKKIEWNALSFSARQFITIGQSGAERVRQYLMSQVDPAESVRMADGFVARYAKCRSDGLTPDEVFQQMVIFAGGATGNPDRDSTALAIVSHFFSTCEIFERPPEAQTV